MVVKQVVDLATINLIHRDSHGKVALVILPVVDTTLEQVLHCQVLQALHRECFARSSLTIREYGNGTSVED